MPRGREKKNIYIFQIRAVDQDPHGSTSFSLLEKFKITKKYKEIGNTGNCYFIKIFKVNFDSFLLLSNPLCFSSTANSSQGNFLQKCLCWIRIRIEEAAGSGFALRKNSWIRIRKNWCGSTALFQILTSQLRHNGKLEKYFIAKVTRAGIEPEPARW